MMGPMMGGGMSPHAPYGIDPITGMPFSDKSKMVAGLLQIFLGSFGVGRFYTGHIGLAVAQLLLSWLTCGIWPLVDGIMILMGKVTDAQGRPLRD
jgi:TM2 domain-containing membrane protein YozV